jgi:hypothetical protein
VNVWQLKSKPEDVLEADKVKLVVLAECAINKSKLTAERTACDCNCVRFVIATTTASANPTAPHLHMYIRFDVF